MRIYIKPISIVIQLAVSSHIAASIDTTVIDIIADESADDSEVLTKQYNTSFDWDEIW